MLDRGGGSDRNQEEPPSFVPASPEDDLLEEAEHEEVSLLSQFVTPLPRDEQEEEAGQQLSNVRELE